jgi:hypothetical protein
MNITALCRFLLILLTVEGAGVISSPLQNGMPLPQVICSNTAPRVYIPMLNVEISAVLCSLFCCFGQLSRGKPHCVIVTIIGSTRFSDGSWFACILPQC